MSDNLGVFRWEDPHYAWIKFHKTITEDQARFLMQQTVDRSIQLPFVLMTVDITDMTGATPESRRVSAQIMEQMPPRAIAVIGGSFAQRMVCKLVLKATEILSGGRQTSSFFKDESQAREWLDSQGEMFLADSAKAGSA